MKDNRETLKNRLNLIFIEKIAFAVDKLSSDQQSISLLSNSIGMQARDLLKLYVELEKEFKIDFSPLVIEGNFDKYDCILEYINKEIGN